MRILTDKKFILLLVITPLFWWLMTRPALIFSEWSSIPQYADKKIRGVFTGQYLRNINDMRWNSFGIEKEDKLSQVFYNKGLILVKEFFNYTTYLSPRTYFQAGDQAGSSPPGIDPIAAPLFFFWILGLLKLIKDKRFKPLLLIFAFTVISYLTERRTMAFLFPTAFIYLYISYLGVKKVFKKKYLKAFWAVFGVYSLYLFGRLIWLI